LRRGLKEALDCILSAEEDILVNGLYFREVHLTNCVASYLSKIAFRQ
jgi:hypothetical protein